jgi:hypothetical protein
MGASPGTLASYKRRGEPYVEYVHIEVSIRRRVLVFATRGVAQLAGAGVAARRLECIGQQCCRRNGANNRAQQAHTHIDERTVDVKQRLRKLLAKPGYNACIQTVRGFGYRFIAR